MYGLKVAFSEVSVALVEFVLGHFQNHESR